MKVRHPHIKVKLVGGDGNAMAILGKVMNGLKQGKVSKEEQELFMKQATAGDYNHLLAVAMQWVNVE